MTSLYQKICYATGGIKQPTRIYQVDTASGALTLKGDVGNTYTPALGLAAASDTVFYLAASDNTFDADGTCFSCLLLRVVLDPASTTPLSITDLGRIEVSGNLVEGVTGLTFRDDGLLHADAEGTEGLYVIDPATVFTTFVGTVTVDSGGGCDTTILDVNGGDVSFDQLDRLWLWTNGSGRKGLWEVTPSNACAVQSASCGSSVNMAGMTVLGHLDAATDMFSSSAQDDRLYRLAPGSCPSSPLAIPTVPSGMRMTSENAAKRAAPAWRNRAP